MGNSNRKVTVSFFFFFFPHRVSLNTEEVPAWYFIIGKFLGKVDIRAEVTDPDGKITQATVEDYMHSDGCYKVLFLGSKTGKHKSNVYVLGEDVNPEGFFFYVVTGRTHSGATFSKKRVFSHNLHPTYY